MKTYFHMLFHNMLKEATKRAWIAHLEIALVIKQIIKPGPSKDCESMDPSWNRKINKKQQLLFWKLPVIFLLAPIEFELGLGAQRWDEQD